ncbi:MAG: hypothetical protein QOJ62_2027 [Actinomycetota bacterium]|nr:hypothetical protein [Actinomycetota bacterium]
MPTIDIGRDAAHDAAQRELQKPIYPRGSLTERLIDWIDELIFKLISEGASVPGGWFTLTVLFVLAAVAVIAVIRLARRTMHTNSGSKALFGAHELTAEEHRAIAQRCAAQGDWAAAIRHRLRAVARQLEESAVLNPVPGRTATELARDAGTALPGLLNEFRSAAEVFNDVTYGERPGTEPEYRTVADLDDRLRQQTRGTGATDASPDVVDEWAALR